MGYANEIWTVTCNLYNIYHFYKLTNVALVSVVVRARSSHITQMLKSVGEGKRTILT